MSAREDWNAGLPRPVTFAAAFDAYEPAVAFTKTMSNAGAYVEDSVHETKCECCGEPVFHVAAGTDIPRSDLDRAYRSWTRHVIQAGGDPEDWALVFFDEPDVDRLDMRPRAARRAEDHGRSRRRRRTRR